jgi:hypothetical protein
MLLCFHNSCAKMQSMCWTDKDVAVAMDFAKVRQPHKAELLRVPGIWHSLLCSVVVRVPRRLISCASATLPLWQALNGRACPGHVSPFYIATLLIGLVQSHH